MKLNRHTYLLSEGPLWASSINKWLFVDILSGCVYATNNDQIIKKIQFPEMVSNIIKISNGFLVSKESSIDVLDEMFTTSETICKLKIESHLRCNDGAVGPDGNYWFGTMEKTPTGLNGKLYSLTPSGELHEQDAQIGIPNSFIWLDTQFVLITDSYLQQTFKVELLPSGKLDWKNKVIWLDLSGTDYTPDGGTLDEEGNIWIAIWGGAAVHKYSPDGVLIDKLALHALQPTSCAFGGELMNTLFVTTAEQGMSNDQLSQYPDSGRVLMYETNTRGKALPIFEVEE